MARFPPLPPPLPSPFKRIPSVRWTCCTERSATRTEGCARAFPLLVGVLLLARSLVYRFDSMRLPIKSLRATAPNASSFSLLLTGLPLVNALPAFPLLLTANGLLPGGDCQQHLPRCAGVAGEPGVICCSSAKYAAKSSAVAPSSTCG